MQKNSLFGDREENQHLALLHGPPTIWLEEVTEKNI